MADAIQDGTLRVTGRLKIELHDADGRLKDVREADNLVVNVGLAWIAKAMTFTAGASQGWMQVGSSGVAPAAADSVLTAQLNGAATQVTSQIATGPSVAYVCTFPPGNSTSPTVQEAGIFNAANAGTMLAHSVFAPINKAAGDSMTITWTITLS